MELDLPLPPFLWFAQGSSLRAHRLDPQKVKLSEKMRFRNTCGNWGSTGDLVLGQVRPLACYDCVKDTKISYEEQAHLCPGDWLS